MHSNSDSEDSGHSGLPKKSGCLILVRVAIFLFSCCQGCQEKGFDCEWWRWARGNTLRAGGFIHLLRADWSLGSLCLLIGSLRLLIGSPCLLIGSLCLLISSMHLLVGGMGLFIGSQEARALAHFGTFSYFPQPR